MESQLPIRIFYKYLEHGKHVESFINKSELELWPGTYMGNSIRGETSHCL